ncbi:tripartite motif-containing protein 16-like [Pundamilia nyererei]|uniref:Tripartite motif-containing protein 16-like n=1 Tax=Pundamilia nyererei TaxID=303518 RepID=A0A9Y3S1U3_9CICH|nr:PREDICTED: tripartite motif-containing protein 16-like [Pundamilia nyererei]
MPQLDREKLCCSICLDLLKDPVTLPCGHSYCMICINNHWDGEDQRGVHSCPQCRKTFIPRPVLGKNTMLAELVEELKKTELQAAPPVHHNYAGPRDVPCDFCTGRKQRATKSCLQCLASYCDDHLQPHYDSQAFQSHKLVEASANLQEKICSLHNKVKEVFCRSDKQCICYLCSISEHKGHDVVSLAAERAERQNELDPCRQNIQQRIQDLEQDLTVLQKQVGVINVSADEAARNSQMVFSQLAQLIARRSSEVQQQIRIQQETETRRVKELEEKLQNEIAELKKKDSELKQLSYTEDHHRFLLTFNSLSALGKSTHTGVNVPPPSFEEVTAAVSQLKDKLQDLLSQGWTQGEAPLRPAELEGSGKQPHIVPAPTSFITKEEEVKSAAFQHQLRVVPPPPAPPSFVTKEEEVKSAAFQQQLHVVPPSPAPPSSVTKEEEVKSAAFQQPRVVPPAEPKSFLKQPRFPPAPHLTAFLATAARKNSLKQHVVPPAEPTALAPLHPALVTPPLPFAPPTEPKTRNDFLQYMCPITLDPNTVSKWLSLSEGNRKVTYMKKEQSYPDHPERFDSLQVLSKEALSGRCYWEVKWSKFVAIAVAYKSISRTGSESGFGFNDKSWALWCHNNEFRHDSTTMSLQVPQSSKIGVYVDQSAGILSFHSVSGSMTLLAKVETTFTEPLHVGLWVCSGSAKLVQLL